MPVALVTGASRGLGLALAQALDRRGWDLVVDARNPADLDAAVATLTGPGRVTAIAGDVAMLESEVNGILKALRQHQLDVVAIHQHMFGTQPQIMFLHYWGTGPATQLAEGFKAALGELGKGHSPAHAMPEPAGKPK